MVLMMLIFCHIPETKVLPLPFAARISPGRKTNHETHTLDGSRRACDGADPDRGIGIVDNTGDVMNANEYLGCTIGLLVLVCFIIVVFMPIRRQNRTGRIPTTGGYAIPDERGTAGMITRTNARDYTETIDRMFGGRG